MIRNLLMRWHIQNKTIMHIAVAMLVAGILIPFFIFNMPSSSAQDVDVAIPKLSKLEVAKYNYEQRHDLQTLLKYGSAIDTSMIALDSIRAQLQAEFFKELAKEAGRRYDINWKVLYGLWQRESEFDPKALGDGKRDTSGHLIPNSYRAFGLGQVHLKTAKGHYDPNITKEQLLDPYINAMASAKTLKDYINMFNGNIKYGVSAYQQGPGETQKQYKQKIDPKNISYVMDVFQNAAELE